MSSNLYLSNNNATSLTCSASTIGSLFVTTGTLSNLLITANTQTLILTTASITTTNLTSTGFINTNQPYMLVIGNSGQIITNNTDTSVTTFWAGAATSSNISQASGVFTVTYAGTYSVAFNIGFSSSSTGQRAFWCTKNNDNTNNLRYGFVCLQATTSDVTSPNISFIIQMAAGDNIRVRCYQNNGVDLTLDTVRGYRFSMVKLF